MNNILLLRYSILSDTIVETPLEAIDQITVLSEASLDTRQGIIPFEGEIGTNNSVVLLADYKPRFAAVDEIEIQRLVSLTSAQGDRVCSQGDAMLRAEVSAEPAIDFPACVDEIEMHFIFNPRGADGDAMDAIVEMPMAPIVSARGANGDALGCQVDMPMVSQAIGYAQTAKGIQNAEHHELIPRVNATASSSELIAVSKETAFLKTGYAAMLFTARYHYFSVRDRIFETGYASMVTPDAEGLSIFSGMSSDSSGSMITADPEAVHIQSDIESGGRSSVIPGVPEPIHVDAIIKSNGCAHMDEVLPEKIFDATKKVSGGISYSGSAIGQSREGKQLKFRNIAVVNSNGFAILQKKGDLIWLDPIKTENILLIRQSHHVVKNGNIIKIT